MRYHSLDNLRATMMLLGILLHATLPYVELQGNVVWPMIDRDSSSFTLTLLLVVIHSFRMPLFFMLAGFFGRMLVEKCGTGGMLRNRVKRILIPFVVSLIVLYVPIDLSATWVRTPEGPHRLARALAAIGFHTETHHLWFLNYLMWLYCIAALIPAMNFARTGFRKLLVSSVCIPVLAVPTALVLSTMRSGMLDTATGLLPAPNVLLAYALFFFFGWLLFTQSDLLPVLERRALLHTILGTLFLTASLVALSIAGRRHLPRDSGAWLTGVACGGVCVWLFIFGLTGLFLRHASHSRRWMNYLADASYWLYITHLPVVMWLHIWLWRWRAPGLVKFAAVVIITLSILLPAYEYLVRRTVLDRYIGGKSSRPQFA